MTDSKVCVRACRIVEKDESREFPDAGNILVSEGSVAPLCRDLTA